MIVGTVILHVAGVVMLGQHLMRQYPKHGAHFNTARSINILTVVTLRLFLLHSIEICAWAGLYMVIGEFTALIRAVYFSTVTFTTLGYDDLTLTADWQALSGIEAANGIIFFGVSTAVLLSTFRCILQDTLSGQNDADK